MEIESRLESIEEEFNKLSTWEGKYRHLIKLGREADEIADELKIENFKIKGCQSQVWLVPKFEDNKLYFSADSDSLLVKGIAALLVKAYSGETPQTIIKAKTDFLSNIGINQHLSMNRSNGLAAMVKQLKYYAIAFSSMQGDK